MNFYKEIFSIFAEIFFAIFIIIFGYYVWDNFDQTDYNTARYYDNIKEVQIAYESDIDNCNNSNNTVLSIHNISDKINNKDVILKINKNNNFDDIIININKTIYNLNDLYISEDNMYNYYLIENIDFKGYETKVYYIDFISDNNIILNDYAFVTEV